VSGLSLIWLTAIVLALGAVAWMITLILFRVLNEHRAKRNLADRRAVEKALLGVLQGQTQLADALGPYRRRAHLMAKSLLDFLTIFRGADLETIVEALRGAGIERVLRDGAMRGSADGRLASIEALGAFGGAETQFILLRAAGRGPGPVRLAALRSLFQAGGDVSVNRMVEHLRRGQLRHSGPTADFMRLVVGRDHAAATEALAEDSLLLGSRVMLLEALGAAGAYGAIPALTENIAAARPEVRAAAAVALGKLMHPAAEPCLRRALDDPSPEVRSAAAEAIGAAGLKTLSKALENGLDDPVWIVRFQSAAALAKFGPSGLGALRKAALASSEAARQAASLVLAQQAHA
jgi:HEAT repeat protein